MVAGSVVGIFFFRCDNILVVARFLVSQPANAIVNGYLSVPFAICGFEI